jgi:hypothetical protein
VAVNPVKAALQPGVRYGALAFLLGAGLGPLREVVLAPWLGGVPAALLEAAVIAPGLWWIARIAVRPIEDFPGWQARIALVLIALFVLLMAEAMFAAVLQATGPSRARVERGEAERLIGLALMAWLVTAPFLVRRG